LLAVVIWVIPGTPWTKVAVRAPPPLTSSFWLVPAQV
jgi:hypothetical protein